MRRKEKQITDQTELEYIIKSSEICHLAMSVDDQPYIVPLCFGYDSKTLYFHSADEGKKLDWIRQNPKVCFQFDTDRKIVVAKEACNWGVYFQSVIGSGTATIVEDEQGQLKGLDLIMNQYANGKWDYKPKILSETVVFKVDISEMSGKKSGN